LPKQFVALGNTVFFSADDIKHGRELWTTGGTQNSTQLYADYNNGGGNAYVNYNSDITGMALFNNNIIALIGNSLMRFDAINPPVLINRLSLVNPSAPEFIKYNNLLFYSGWSDSEGYELWTTNGIATSLFKNLTPGYSYDRPNSFIVSGGFLYFITGGTKLWKSDGTVAGTVLVKTISGYIQSKFTEANGKLYFTVQDNTNGAELWVSDGTDIGTKIVKDIYVGSSGSNPRNLVSLNGSLYFSAYSGTGYNIWKTDGTSNNTVAIFNDYTLQIATLKDKLYFIAYDYSVSQYALWQSAGTAGSVTKIKNLSQNLYDASVLFNVEDKYLVFDILPNTTLDELWMTDGTVAETKKVKNIKNVSTSSYAASSDFFYNNKKLYFVADDGVSGRELWMWDFACADNYTVTDTLKTDTTLITNRYIVGLNVVKANAKVNYSANNYIDFNQGFDVQKGSVFATSLVGCGSTPTASLSLTDSKKQITYSAADLKYSGEYQPNVSQFLEEQANVELREIYFKERQQGNADKIQWIIQSETDRYVLKLSVDNQEYLGYLPKK
jgi:ELWxxDGT repeat protein